MLFIKMRILVLMKLETHLTDVLSVSRMSRSVI